MNLITKQDHLMRELFNQAIGFDSLFNRLVFNPKESSFPPYNITKHNNDTTVELALAGYNKEDISVLVEDGVLSIEGHSSKSPLSDSKQIHKGIASRKFKRCFSLGEHVEVVSADLENGLLTILLQEIIPEEKKPKVIEIN